MPGPTLRVANTPGGCHRARRLFAVVVTAAAVAGGGVATVAADGPSPVVVARVDGVYRVSAAFAVTQSVAVVTATLTDYAGIPRFMPEVRTSQVIERTPTGALVVQEAQAKFLMFSRRVHLVLDVRESAGRIQFKDRCGTSFTQYEGAWTIGTDAGATQVSYELSAQPSFDVPEFVLRRLLKRDATQMITRLKAEIASRAH